jgi:hypothetical protein
MLASVYLLCHDYETPTSLDNGKILGIFGSEADALKAQATLASKPGFFEYPDGFTIGQYIVDDDHWTEGFGESE